MRRGILIALVASLACACTKENPLASLPDLSAVRANLAFTCVHEDDHLPPLDPDADQLFRYGRWLQKQDGPKDFDDIARYYRIAAAHDHYKANTNLQALVSTGLADSPDAPKETIDLAAQLVKQGVPAGYYDIAHYLELGYGLKQNSETALRYFRKAADLGSPDAQYYLAEKLFPVDAAPEVALQMYRCSADQGHGKAATSLAIGRADDEVYAEALRAFQQGVMAGNRLAAWVLENGFAVTPENRVLYYLAVPNDPERSRRYKAIGKFLDGNEGLNPKVPDVDQIVPLPPARYRRGTARSSGRRNRPQPCRRRSPPMRWLKGWPARRTSTRRQGFGSGPRMKRNWRAACRWARSFAPAKSARRTACGVSGDLLRSATTRRAVSGKARRCRHSP